MGQKLNDFFIVFLNYCWQHKFRDAIKNHFSSRTRDKLKFYRLSDATFYDCINIFINISWIKKCLFFEEYGAFNKSSEIHISILSNLNGNLTIFSNFVAGVY